MRIFLYCLLIINFAFAAPDSLVGKKYEDLKLKQESCPIKKVSISKHKTWLGYVQFNNGVVVALSSPKYTFAYSLQNKKEDIYKVYITDYKTGKIIDSQTAFYVFGSRIMSVGGDDIIPFSKKVDAQDFLEKQSGKKIYNIDRMSANFINYLELR